MNILALDDAAEVNLLVDQLREDLELAPRDASSYQGVIGELVRHVTSTRREGSRLDVSMSRWWRRGLPQRVGLVAGVLVALLAAIRGFLYPITFTGTVLTTDGVLMPKARVHLNGNSLGETAEDGTMRFTTGWFPKQHQFRLAAASGTWSGPTWRQLFDLQAATVELRVGDGKIQVAGARSALSVFAAFAAQPKPSVKPPKLPVPSYEFGFWLQSVRVGSVPGFFRKAKRGYFRVMVGGQQSNDDDVRNAPLVLKGISLNRFPVEVNPRSWLLVNENETLPYKGIYCRLPGDPIALLKANSEAILKAPVRMQFVGDTGDVLSEFDLTAALQGPLQGSPVSGSNGYELRIRPEVRVDPSAKLSLDWLPQESSVQAGRAIVFRVVSEGSPLPFDIEIALTATPGGKVPATITIPRGAIDRAFFVSFTPGHGKVKLESRMPAALGGSTDDAEVRVR